MNGVAALIVVLSIFNAFQNIAITQIVGFDPHLKFEKISDYQKFYSFKEKYLLKNNLIEKQALTSESRIVCFRNGISRTTNLITVNEKDLSYFSNFETHLVIGNLKLNTPSYLPNVVIGAGLADALRVLPGDTLFLTTAGEIESSIISHSFPLTHQVTVIGIYQTNVKDYDYNYIFSSNILSEILLKSKYTKSLVYNIRLKDLDLMDKMYLDIKTKAKDKNLDFKLISWKDLNKEYYNVMKFEKMSTSFILGLIILVAIFNVFASLTMTIIEKKKDISILRAIGGHGKFIQRIYFYEGIFVGSIGSICGGILGLILCYGQLYFKWFKIDNVKYIMDSIPVLINYSDVLAIVILSFVLSVIATAYPAWKSSKFSLIENLREE
jgi:lipoprotein-releasing system permease protein